MPVRAHVQLVFVDAEGGFGLGELDVGLPQLLVAPVLDVGAQHVGAFRDGGPIVEGVIDLDMQAKAGRTVGRLQGDLEASSRALVAPQDAADLAVDLGGLEPFGRILDARAELGQRRFDAAAELVVHGLPFAAPRSLARRPASAAGLPRPCSE